MSNLLAIDVVLLPPQNIMQQIIKLIDYPDAAPLILNQVDCFPHVSLAMGILKEEDLDAAHNKLEQTVINHSPIDITLRDIVQHSMPDGNFIHVVEPIGNKQLTELHMDIMQSLRSLLTHNDVQTNMFYSPPEVAEISTHWVKHYYDKQGPEDFKPHITLGFGKITTLKAPIKFTANRFALCHLGTYCTCRRILSEVTLT